MKGIWIIIFSIIIILIGTLSFAASFGAYTEVSDGISIGPSFDITFNTLSATVDFMGAIGVLKGVDFQFSFSKVLIQENQLEWLGLSMMPRYDLGGLEILKYNILSLFLGYSGEFNLGIGYHTGLGLLRDVLDVEVNLGVDILPSPGINGIIAPVLWLQEIVRLPLSLYFETDLYCDLSNLSYNFIVGFSVVPIDNLELNLGYALSGSIVGYIMFSF
ncbi:MAG: hypothetical protein N2712_01495 [Brevinematales bacterium]|nr:hypothetical protein [Brevinematales bacterium]